jgi:hypothetical protein
MPILAMHRWLFGPPETNPLPETLPADLAARWGAFLHEGLMVSLREPTRPAQILATWPSGCIELITQACEALDLLWQQARSPMAEERTFPGVFEYEVVSELGRLMGDHLLEHDGQLPDDGEIRQMCRRLVRQFFGEADTAEAEPAS